MQTKHLCVLIHIWTKSEVGAQLNWFKPSSKLFYWPFQGGTSFVDLLFFLSCVYYAFVHVYLYVPCGHLLGKGWPLGSRLWCLTVSLLLSHWYPGSSWYLIVSIPDLCPLTNFKYYNIRKLEQQSMVPNRKYTLLNRWPLHLGQDYTKCCPVPSACNLCTCKIWSCYVQRLRRRYIHKKIHYMTLTLGSSTHKMLPSTLHIILLIKVTTSNSLGEDAFTGKYIIWPLTLVTGNVAQYHLHYVTYAPC